MPMPSGRGSKAWAIKAQLAIKLACESMTPLGAAVLPDEKMIAATTRYTSSPSGLSEKRRIREQMAPGAYLDLHVKVERNWQRQDRSLDGEELVLWPVLGTHHFPRPEQWPVMPVDSLRLRLEPDRFNLRLRDQVPILQRGLQIVFEEINRSQKIVGVFVGGIDAQGAT